jgi:DNA-directed RNA polymerase specialized sigma24 family protein
MGFKINERHIVTAAQIDACPHIHRDHAAILRLSLTEKSYQSIADVLGLRSVGTVKSRLNRARTALAAELEAKAKTSRETT